MYRVAPIILALLAIRLFFAVNTSVADDRTVSVTVDGYSYLGDNDTIKTARERALAEAERNAIEQGSYSYLESHTTVKDFQVTSDEISSRVSGVISNKKILVDEMEKDTLRYHIRLEAEVKLVDKLERPPEQPQSVSPSSDDGIATQIRGAPVERNLEQSGPSKQDLYRTLQRLLKQRNEHPHRYIQYMSRTEPQINRTESFVSRLRRLETRNPEAARKVRTKLSRTPIQVKGKRQLADRLRYLRKNRPREYILIMEILFPEVRPPALARDRLENREGRRKPGKVYPAPVRLAR
ncbi:MAG: hypothetical protein JSU72_10755 [Deltaproteobacteria bacterium]|nr:MAG: hypothetical protein JSU72_10755 [Deltaproteobacteria bacterium]